MKNKTSKGQYGYRDHRRRVRLGLVLFGALMIIAQLAARQFTDNQAAKNILTVMAILSVLPAANVASPLLASWRYRTPSEEFHKRVSAYEGGYTILYDLIVTTRELILPLDAVVVHPRGIYAYCTSKKADAAKAEKALNELLTAQRLDANMKIIKDETGFFHRLESLKPAAEYEDDGSVECAARFLKNMSM